MRTTAPLLVGLFFSFCAACSGVQVHRRTDPNLVALDTALGNRFVAAGSRSEVIARVHIAGAAEDPTHRPPINLALVVDTSGSMEGRPIDDARAASLALLDTMGDDDFLSVVAFGTRVEVLVPSTRLDRAHRAEARERLRTMRAQGTTNLSEGLTHGLSQLGTHYIDGGVNRVILMSDGNPNDSTGIEAMAQSAGARGISITSLGLGLDYNETLMGAIAQRSGGRFHYVDDSSRVAAVFRDEVLRMRRVVGRNAVAVLTPGPDVTIDSVVGVDASRAGTVVTIPIGDVTEGESRDLIVRMTAGGRRAGASVELLDVTVNFDDTVQNAGHLERHSFLGARATSDTAELTSGRNPAVEQMAAEVTLSAGTLAAIREARDGRVEQAQAQLDAVLNQAQRTAREQNNTSLERRASAASSLRSALGSMGSGATPAATTVPVATHAHPTRPMSVAPEMPAPITPPSQVVRAMHDEAMQSLQGN